MPGEAGVSGSYRPTGQLPPKAQLAVVVPAGASPVFVLGTERWTEFWGTECGVLTDYRDMV